MNEQDQKGIGEYFGYAALAAIGITALGFLGLHSLNFFTFTFPGDQQFYAYLGFGLTGGAFIGYIVIFKTIARTKLKKFVSISMIFLCLAGELATAGFGMQLESYRQAGIAFTAEDINAMIWAIRLLGVVHGLALVLEFVGDDMIGAFRKEGVPIDNTVFDRRKQSQPREYEQVLPSPTEIIQDEALAPKAPFLPE